MRTLVLLAALATAIPALARAQNDPIVVGAAKPSSYAGAADLNGQMAKSRETKTSDDMPKGPKAYVGAWVVGKDGEGADVCTVRFNAAGVIGGFQLVAPKNCKGAVEHWDDLYAWRIGPGGEIVMADATRRSMYVFKKLDDEVWATEGADWDRLLLRRASKVGISR